MGDAKCVQKSNEHFPHKLRYWEKPNPPQKTFQYKPRFECRDCSYHRNAVSTIKMAAPMYTCAGTWHGSPSSPPPNSWHCLESLIDAHARRNVSERAESKRPPVFGGQTTLHRELSLSLTKAVLKAVTYNLALAAGYHSIVCWVQAIDPLLSERGDLGAFSNPVLLTVRIKIKQDRMHFNMFWVNKKTVLSTANSRISLLTLAWDPPV